MRIFLKFFAGRGGFPVKRRRDGVAERIGQANKQPSHRPRVKAHGTAPKRSRRSDRWTRLSKFSREMHPQGDKSPEKLLEKFQNRCCELPCHARNLVRQDTQSATHRCQSPHGTSGPAPIRLPRSSVGLRLGFGRASICVGAKRNAPRGLSHRAGIGRASG